MKAGAALICRRKHEYSEISSIPYPLSQTIPTTCDLSSLGLLTRFADGGLNFLSWTSFNPVRKQSVIPIVIIIMSLSHQKALHRAGHYSRPEGAKQGCQRRTFLPHCMPALHVSAVGKLFVSSQFRFAFSLPGY